MPDFDIDSLKKQWQEQKVPNKYDNSEILRMLNSKSRNYVKYIFWISAAEFLIFLTINILYIFKSDGADSFIHILEKMGVQKTVELEANYAHLYFVMKLASLIVTGYFVIKFYLNYRKINVEENLKAFINQIVKFRKTVNQFIFINIGLLVLFMAILTCFVYYIMSTQNIQLTNPTMLGFITGLIISTLLMVLLIWLYYRIVYGTFTHRLGKNLKQLKEIEQNQ